jgi:hypothetical protein
LKANIENIIKQKQHRLEALDKGREEQEKIVMFYQKKLEDAAKEREKNLAELEREFEKQRQIEIEKSIKDQHAAAESRK